MKTIILAFLTIVVAAPLAACFTTETAACQGDDCVCTASEACTHDCAPGAAQCHVQGSRAAVDVACHNNAECHVECSSSTSCAVDCGGSDECHVTCPASGCTVTGCIGDACEVTCGLVGVASRSGTTATCP